MGKVLYEYCLSALTVVKVMKTRYIQGSGVLQYYEEEVLVVSKFIKVDKSLKSDLIYLITLLEDRAEMML